MRQEPSAKADITFSEPRIHSPGLEAGPTPGDPPTRDPSIHT
jgi:hypothetical protein